MLRFVILRHEDVAQPHFDLMFETAPGSSLATWRSPNWPIFRPTRLVRLGEHRRAYLDYEGSLSGGRGSVTRVAFGHCRIERAADDSHWAIHLSEDLPALNLRRVTGDDWLAVPSCGG